MRKDCYAVYRRPYYSRRAGRRIHESRIILAADVGEAVAKGRRYYGDALEVVCLIGRHPDGRPDTRSSRPVWVGGQGAA